MLCWRALHMNSICWLRVYDTWTLFISEGIALIFCFNISHGTVFTASTAYSQRVVLTSTRKSPVFIVTSDRQHHRHTALISATRSRTSSDAWTLFAAPSAIVTTHCRQTSRRTRLPTCWCSVRLTEKPKTSAQSSTNSAPSGDRKTRRRRISRRRRARKVSSFTQNQRRKQRPWIHLSCRVKADDTSDDDVATDCCHLQKFMWFVRFIIQASCPWFDCVYALRI